MKFPKSCIYEGTLSHVRFVPNKHKFIYKVFYLFLDLEKLDELKKKFIFFSYNKFNFLSFNDKDHGYRNSTKTIYWVKNNLKKIGLGKLKMRIYILCMPRILGYIFNPLTLYFCYDQSNFLRSVMYEVKNTFNEQHSYIFRIKGNLYTKKLFNHKSKKKFHVSPFWDMSANYNFKLRLPEKNFFLEIKMSKNKKIFSAFLKTYYKKINEKNLFFKLLKYPFLNIKVVFGIHYEALKIFLKGGKYYKKPTLKQKLTIIK